MTLRTVREERAEMSCGSSDSWLLHSARVERDVHSQICRQWVLYDTYVRKAQRCMGCRERWGVRGQGRIKKVRVRVTQGVGVKMVTGQDGSVGTYVREDGNLNVNHSFGKLLIKYSIIVLASFN